MSYQYIGEELDVFRYASNWKRYWAAKVFDVLPHGIQAIEIGSGIGGNFEAITNYTDKYTGVEPDPELVKVSLSEYPQATFTVGNLRSLKFSQDIKALFYIDVLEHIEDDQLELNYAEGFLSAGSFMVILVPAHMKLYSDFDKRIGHFRRYSQENLISIIPASFKCLFISELDSLGFMLSFLSKKLRNSGSISSFQVRLWDSLIPISKALDKWFGLSGKSILLILRKI